VSDFLKKFKDLTRGMAVREVLTLEWVQAVQEGLRYVAEGRNITTGPGVKRCSNDGRLWLDAAPGVSTPSKASVVIPPLSIVTSKPSYIPDAGDVPQGHQRFYITWGLVNGVLLDNWDEVLDVPIANKNNTKRFLYIKAFVTTTSTSNLLVTSCLWDTEDSQAAVPKTPDWPVDGSRPAHIIIPLGNIWVIEGTSYPFSQGGGSIEINEHIASINDGDSGSSVYIKRFSYMRIYY